MSRWTYRWLKYLQLPVAINCSEKKRLHKDTKFHFEAKRLTGVPALYLEYDLHSDKC